MSLSVNSSRKTLTPIQLFVLPRNSILLFLSFSSHLRTCGGLLEILVRKQKKMSGKMWEYEKSHMGKTQTIFNVYIWGFEGNICLRKHVSGMGGHNTHTRARARRAGLGRGPWALGLGPWYLVLGTWRMRFAGVGWVLWAGLFFLVKGGLIKSEDLINPLTLETAPLITSLLPTSRFMTVAVPHYSRNFSTSRFLLLQLPKSLTINSSFISTKIYRNLQSHLSLKFLSFWANILVSNRGL